MDDYADVLEAAVSKPRRVKSYDEDSALDLIAQHESGGRNIKQQVVPAGGGYNPSVGKVTGPSSAQGPWQITNSTWRKRAPREIAQKYPTAMAAPVDVQRNVARKIFRETGFQDWEPYNASLRRAIRRGEQPRPQKAQDDYADVLAAATEEQPRRAPSPVRKAMRRTQEQPKVDPMDLVRQVGGAVTGEVLDKPKPKVPLANWREREADWRRRDERPQAPTYDNIDPRLAKGEQPRDPMAYAKAQELVGRTESQREVGRLDPGANAVSARRPSLAERAIETVKEYAPGIRSLDTPMGIKTDPIRGAASLGLVDLRRTVSPEEHLVNPNAQAEAEQAYGIGAIAPAVIPYVGAGKVVSKIPSLAANTRQAHIARTALTFGGVELGREMVRTAQTGEPLNPQEVAISTAIGGSIGGIAGVNPGLKKQLVAFITPGVVADVARGADPQTATFNALTNLAFGLHSYKAAPKEVKDAAKLVRGKANEAQTETQPNIERPITEGQPERIAAVGEGVPRVEDVANIPPPEAVRPQPELKQWQHRDFGLVTESANQSGTGKGRVRVTTEDGTDHIIQRPKGTGAGNQIAIPVRESQVNPSQGEAAKGKVPEVTNVRSPSATVLRNAASGTYAGETRTQNTVADVDSLVGGVRLSDPTERARVDQLKRALQQPDAYFERVVVDGEGNVIEGQHRLEAARELGIKEIPVVRVSPVSDAIPNAQDVIKELGDKISRHPEQVRGLVDRAAEIVQDEGIAGLREYEAPRGFEKEWDVLLGILEHQATTPPVQPSPPSVEKPAAAPQPPKAAAPKQWQPKDAETIIAELPLEASGYNAELVGGVKKKGQSEHDIDILLTPRHENFNADAIWDWAVKKGYDPMWTHNMETLEVRTPDKRVIDFHFGEEPASRTASTAQPLKPKTLPERTNPPLASAPRTAETETPASSTSARKAQFAEDRAELDLPELPTAERKSWRQSLSEAKPETADRLAEEVLRKPRALNDSETASIVVRAQQVKNEHAAKMKEVYEATDAEAIAAKRVEAEVLEAEFDKLTQAAKASGTEKGRTLAAQKLTINQDFDLVSVKARMKAAKGRPLTEKENARYEDMVRQRDQAIVERDAALEKARVQQIDREIQRVSRQRKRAETKEALDEEAAVIRQNIAAEFARIKSAQNIQASGLAGLDPEGVISKNLLKYARNRVKANVGIKAEQLIDDVHSLVKDFVDRRQVAELISGYKLELPEKQAADVQRLREIRSEIKSLLKQEDVAAGRITEKAQGVPRQIFSRNAQRLKQLQKQEAELTRRIEEGDFSKRTRPEPLPYTRDVQRAQERVTILENQFKREAERARPGHQLRNVSGVWKAWLLSSPNTHAMNALGTGSYQVFREASRLPAAIADAVWSGTRKTFGYGAQRSIQGPSPSAMLDSVLYGGKVGGREAMETLRMGAPREVMERHQYQEIDFGVNTGIKGVDSGVKAIELAHNMVFRLMSASDRVFYQGAYRRNLLDRAAMQAKNEGLKGREVTRRAEELAKEPSTEMEADAKHDALVSTFNNNNFLSQRIRQARAARVHSKLVSERGAERINAAENLALDLVLPFERTPTNVLSRIVEASPAGYVKNAGQLISAAIRRSMSQEHQRQFMQTFGNATTGTALMALGWLIGDSLIDIDEKSNVYLKIPGLPRVNLRTASPVGNVVAMGARLRKNYDEDAGAYDYVKTVGREVTNQPLLRATSTVSDLAQEPERSAPKIGARYAASAIPFSGAVRFAAQTIDPEDARFPKSTSFKEQFQQNIPIWRQALESKPRRKGRTQRKGRPEIRP